MNSKPGMPPTDQVVLRTIVVLVALWKRILLGEYGTIPFSTIRYKHIICHRDSKVYNSVWDV